jgi:hypothetical protein
MTINNYHGHGINMPCPKNLKQIRNTDYYTCAENLKNLNDVDGLTHEYVEDLLHEKSTYALMKVAAICSSDEQVMFREKNQNHRDTQYRKVCPIESNARLTQIFDKLPKNFINIKNSNYFANASSEKASRIENILKDDVMMILGLLYAKGIKVYIKETIHGEIVCREILQHYGKLDLIKDQALISEIETMINNLVHFIKE